MCVKTKSRSGKYHKRSQACKIAWIFHIYKYKAKFKIFISCPEVFSTE